MAIKVRHRMDGRVYALLGVGFGAFKSSRPSVFLDNLLPTEEEGQMEMVAVCDGEGKVRWTRSDDIEVLEIDGQTPAELLG